MMKKYIVLSLLVLVFSLSLFNFLNSARSEISREMLIMGTVCRISIIADKNFSVAQAENAINQAFSLLKNYEREWSFFSDDSDLALINRQAAEKSVKLSADTFEIINKSLELSRKSDGAFDVTATSLHKQGGYGTIVLDPQDQSVRFTDQNTKIDLGGIAAGYAIDKVVGLFAKNNVKNYLIDVGGDIYASGKNEKNKLWAIGVRDPFDEKVVIYDFDLKNESVTTSGNYVKKHIIDPKTSGLAGRNIESVTVVAPTCLDADALATTFFILGIEKTKKFIDVYNNDIQVLFVKAKNKTPEIIKCNWKK